jgi:dihydroxyacetone kinase
VDLVQQAGVTVEQDEEFHQRERGLGLAVLVTRKGIGAAAEDGGRLALVEPEFLADTR